MQSEMRRSRVGAGDGRGSEKKCLMEKLEIMSRCQISLVLDLLRSELNLCMTVWHTDLEYDMIRYGLEVGRTTSIVASQTFFDALSMTS